MRYHLFQDLIQPKRPRKLTRFFLISILVHIFIIYSISEAPLRSSGSLSGSIRQNPTHEAGGFDYKKSRITSSETGINDGDLPGVFTKRNREIPPQDNSRNSERAKGEIQGYIYDEMKDNIQGVEITAINLNSDLTIKTVSDDMGQYAFKNLPPGIYHVEAEADNYSKFSKNDILLKEGEPLTVDVRLIPLYLSKENTFPTVQGRLEVEETINSKIPEILAFLRFHPVGGVFSSYVKIGNVVFEDSITILYNLGFSIFYHIKHSLMFFSTFF